MKQTATISRFSATLAQSDSEQIAKYLVRHGRVSAIAREDLDHRRRQADLCRAQPVVYGHERSVQGHGQPALVRTSVVDVAAFVADTRNRITVFNADVDQNMRSTGMANLENNDETQQNMMITGAVGLLLGMIIAVIIVMGIVCACSGS